MKDEDIDREKTTQEIDVPRYLTSFRSFGVLDVNLPAGFVDASHKDEVCPRFHNLNTGQGVWINYKRIEDRPDHTKDQPRFWIYVTHDEQGNPLEEKPGRIVFESDNWDEILNHLNE